MLYRSALADTPAGSAGLIPLPPSAGTELDQQFTGGEEALTIAFEEAERTKKPVVVLVGDEYHGFNR